MAEMTIDDEPSRLQRSLAGVRRGARGTARLIAEALTIDRLFAILAVVLLPAGIAAIVLGWMGAARTPFLFEQIPYLISGGLLGVGLLTVGGLLYVGSWIARSAEQARERDEQLRGVLGDLRDELRQARTQVEARAAARPAVDPTAAGTAPGTATAGPGTAAGEGASVSGAAVAADTDRGPASTPDATVTSEVPTVRPFVATPSGTMFHRPECSVVASRGPDQLRRVAGDETRMRPCGMCAPLG